MAPVPSFVGYSPWATSVLPTGSIVTVTSSCLPSGTAIGDDVFVFIRFSQFVGGGSGPSPTTPSGWQRIYTVFNSNSDFTLVYRTRYKPSSFPMSVALTGAGPTPPGTVIATSKLGEWTWPGDRYRFTHVCDHLFLHGQGVQLICTQAGAHNLFTIQPISSSAN